MAQSSRDPKLFTLEEANRLLPTVRGFLKSLRQRRDRVDKLEKEKAVEELSWLQEDGTVSPKAQDELIRLGELQSQEIAAFEEELGKLADTGAQLKDLNEGLVDFFTARGGEIVYLCWKDGEDRILFWHDLESGAAGRKPIEEL